MTRVKFDQQTAMLAYSRPAVLRHRTTRALATGSRCTSAMPVGAARAAIVLRTNPPLPPLSALTHLVAAWAPGVGYDRFAQRDTAHSMRLRLIFDWGHYF